MYQLDISKNKPWLQYHIQDCHDNGLKEVTAVEAIEGRSKIITITGSTHSRDLKLSAFIKENNPNSTYIVRGNEASKYCSYFYFYNKNKK